MESVIYVGARAQPRRPLWTQLAAAATAIGFGLFLFASPDRGSSELLRGNAVLWLYFMSRSSGGLATSTLVARRPDASV
jgi:hypothetical protein